MVIPSLSLLSLVTRLLANSSEDNRLRCLHNLGNRDAIVRTYSRNIRDNISTYRISSININLTCTFALCVHPDARQYRSIMKAVVTNLLASPDS